MINPQCPAEIFEHRNNYKYRVYALLAEHILSHFNIYHNTYFCDCGCFFIRSAEFEWRILHQIELNA